MVCDWYNIPATDGPGRTDSGPTQVPAATEAAVPTPTTGVSTLPGTGSGPTGTGPMLATVLAGTSLLMVAAGALTRRQVFRRRVR